MRRASQLDTHNRIRAAHARKTRPTRDATTAKGEWMDELREVVAGIKAGTFFPKAD